MADTKYTAAVTITDGKVVGAPTVDGPRPQATLAEGLAIQSSEEGRNGLIVAGPRSALTVRNAKVRMTGAGTNDFLGTGAGIMARDHSALVLDHVDVETSAPIAPALVAAEGAHVEAFDSRFVAHGGPLPPDYEPRIGPGMMEPPPPLGLSGTARTVLAMSNSHTVIRDSEIVADGWGALSTDATGGDLYLACVRCRVTVPGRGYGTYADFGAHVAIADSNIDSGAYQGIIAGKARIDFDRVTGRAADSAVMIHSVMAFDVAEEAALTIKSSSIKSGGPVLLVKSANAQIEVSGSTLASDKGVLLEVRRNEDTNATKTNGAVVPGVKLTLGQGTYAGAVLDTDPDRTTTLMLDRATLAGKLQDVILGADPTSKWTATANSSVVMAPGAALSTIDASGGVTVTVSGTGRQAGVRAAPSGGTIRIIS